MQNRVSDAFQAIYHSKPETIARAPGRVNLIGEHTDYNDGFVLPMAIDRAVWIALRPRPDRLVQVHALDMAESAEFDLDALTKGETRWVDYMKGVAGELQAEGFMLQGWEGVMAGNVPRGAGLSSSAALEVVTARAFAVVSGIQWDALRMARLAQRAENNWVGVRSGIMDQAVSAAARAGHAFFLDCRSLEYEHIPLAGRLSIVVMDTSTRRGLVDSAYNERHAQCEAAARAFGVRALRDVNMDQFKREMGKLDGTTMRRARHVVTENARVLEAVQAMRAEDAAALGRLFNESHASLRDDFQVTGEALDLMVEIARSRPDCYGARMTGAGFGGCAVAVVRREGVEAFANEVGVDYQRRSGRQAEMFICEASAGASLQ